MADKMKTATSVADIMASVTDSESIATKEESTIVDAVISDTESETKEKPKKKRNITAKQKDIKAIRCVIKKVNNPELAKLLQSEIANIKKEKPVKLTTAFYAAVGKAFIKATGKNQLVGRDEIKNILASSYKDKLAKIK